MAELRAMIGPPARHPLRVLSGHFRAVNAVGFAGGGKQVLTGGEDGTLRLWDAQTGNQLASFRGHSGPLVDLAVCPDGVRAITTSRDNTVALWDLTRRRMLAQWRSPTTTGALGVSPDGARFAVVMAPTVWVSEVETGRPLRPLNSFAAEVGFLSATKPGDRIVTSFLVTLGPGRTEQLSQHWDFETARVTTRRDFFHSKDVASAGPWQAAAAGDTVRVSETWLDREHLLWGHTGFVEALGVSGDGRTLITGSMDKTARVWDLPRGRLLRVLAGHTEPVWSVALSEDGRRGLTGSLDGTARFWDVSAGKVLRVRSREVGVTAVALNEAGSRALVGSFDGAVDYWNLSTGRIEHQLRGHTATVTGCAFAYGGRVALTGSGDGTTRAWDLTTGTELCSIVTFTDTTWAVVAPDGRFDCSNLEDVQGLHWIVPDDPLTPLSVDVFMRQYYEPRLLSRLLAGERLPPIPSIASLNRVQPEVVITGVEREGNGDTAAVTVRVSSYSRAYGGRTYVSGAQDLRLFRDGQLVARDPGVLVAAGESGERVIRFPGIRLPRAAGRKEVQFSAYCFNVDLVKSLTGRHAFALPADLAPSRGRAYLIALGANDYGDDRWNLRYAAADAQGMLHALAVRLRASGRYEAVVEVPLVSAGDRLDATKANLRVALTRLGGGTVAPADAARYPGGAAALAALHAARPEDAVVISVSSHGYSASPHQPGGAGVFYLFPTGIGPFPPAGVTDALLRQAISSDELSEWLRPVDAGEIAMVIDACHSAASVEGEGFKPGPMGSRGLGQLAYDKGMRILAASQARDVALEVDRLGHGLLTYALLRDGLDGAGADWQPRDGRIVLDEWLGYGVTRVPRLWELIRTGQAIQTKGPGGMKAAALAGTAGSLRHPKVGYQQPALFDFRRRPSEVSLGAAP